MDLTVLCDMYRFSPEPHSWPAYVIAYHLTPASNVESIMANGLTAKQTRATERGEHRIAAVYLIAHKGDAYDANVRKFLLNETDIIVLRIKIPQNEFGKMREDGLFNMSCICEDGSYPTGIQYVDNIPAEWISKI